MIVSDRLKSAAMIALNHGEVDECEARDVPTRTRQAGHEALSDWIVDHREDDRDGVGRLFKCCSNRAAGSDNEVR